MIRNLGHFKLFVCNSTGIDKNNGERDRDEERRDEVEVERELYRKIQIERSKDGETARKRDGGGRQMGIQKYGMTVR